MNFSRHIRSHKWELIIIICLIALGIFLRAYNFSPWLHFEIDQDYDILLVSRAVTNSISSLPLLGPNAGGGLLRLGPAYYYLEYVSALIFGNTPTGSAVFVLIFSILALPLFYVFVRRYFSRIVSLGLLAIFSCSFFSILYSRFAWSPNVLPFLMLLAGYALLRSVSKEEKRREAWFLLSVLATTIITQIHFNVFFVMPVIFVSFLLIKRPHFKLQIWLAAVAIVLVAYAPMIASDIMTKGQNVRYLLQKTHRTAPAPSRALVSLMQDGQYFSSEFFLINSGLDHINGARINGSGFQTGSDRLWRIGALLLCLAELCCFVKIFWPWRNFKDSSAEKKDFLILSGAWFAVFFVYFFYLLTTNYRMYPRFFLPLVPLAIIFFGFLLEKIRPEKNRRRLSIFLFIILIFCVSNLQATWTYFNQLSIPEAKPSNVGLGDVLPNTNRVTLDQQVSAVNYIETIQRQNDYPIYIATLHELEPALWYQLEKDGHDFWGELTSRCIYRQGNYFLVFPTAQHKVFQTHFTTAETKTFGALTVARLVPIPANINSELQMPATQATLGEKEEFTQVATWQDFFNRLGHVPVPATAKIIYAEQAEKNIPDSN